MKSKIVLQALIFTFFFSSFLSAQWTHQEIPGVTLFGFDIKNNSVILGGWGAPPPTLGIGRYSTDLGTSFSDSQVPDSLRDIKQIRIMNNTLVYAVGEFFKPGARYNFSGIFLQSVDGGISFQIKGSLPDSIISLCKMEFPDIDHGFSNAYCDLFNAGILKTSDGGLTWQWSLNPQKGTVINSISFYDAQNGFGTGLDTVSGNSFIVKTTDGGNSWTNNTVPGKHFVQVKAVSSSRIIVSASTESGWEILLSTDNGATWNVKKTFPSGVYLPGVNASDGIMMIYGKVNDEISAVFTSLDNGDNWEQKTIYPLTGVVLTDSRIISASEWFFIGGNSTYPAILLHTTNSGGTFVGLNEDFVYTSDEINPGEFRLFQNYPNPFNPSTKIKFNLPEASEISFRVFNVIGQEVYSVINQQMEPGIHEVSFNAYNIPAGIYFYELKTGSFSDIKKMVLLK